jgi:hypothetical protein|eukprot:CAMPEP_0185589488 /NCGR_PEP_ID=MMETSP0434-20130131/57260_1 /TAXON_ID=626734 ORGANISM="Favella taraikaensis, Strain Fe Narragansett Bay" /NCGR_SAMPLE_ID=MMETSP0434 /ASSEMBLY_ACC=CAM_ASM_000379 /LENGTH=72 /DNA_ID=CAMNT_0028212921 /DNA_START=868 /DNA_END=1086 /DNA_ORIENTATION=-
MEDAMVAAARAQERVVPRDGADASVVPAHRVYDSILDGIPDLELAGVSTDCKEAAVAAPLYASYSIGRTNIA